MFVLLALLSHAHFKSHDPPHRRPNATLPFWQPLQAVTVLALVRLP